MRDCRVAGNLLAITFLTLTFACGGQDSAESVSFRTSDGFVIQGKLYGDGKSAVVLAHEFNSNQDSWRDFAAQLAGEGFTALTFDFRGYGNSQGAKDISLIHRDVAAALRFLSEERKARRVVVIGASMGGTASLIAADRAEVPVVAISAPAEFMGLNAKVHIAGIGGRKLFVASNSDKDASDSATELFKLAADPSAELKLFTGDAHGTELFQSKHADELTQLLLRFVRGP